MSRWQPHPAAVPIDYAAHFRSAREALLDLLGDLGWHGWGECSARAGIRYGARVRELRQEGYTIEDEPHGDGKRYRLASLTPGAATTATRVRLMLEHDEMEMLADNLFVPAAIRTAARKALASHRPTKKKAGA